MHPVLIEIGRFSVYSFGFMLAISFLAGIYLSSYRAKRFGIDPQHILDLSVYLILAGVVGSRLLYVAFHITEYQSFIDVFALWQGGATLYGGFLLAFFCGFVFSQKKKISFLLLGDIFAPALALGIMVTRIGCFLSGCCYGKETAHSWGVHFPLDSPAGTYAHEAALALGLDSVGLHPAQLYSSFCALVTLAIILVLQKRVTKRGATFGLLLLCYGIARFGLDFTRVYEESMRVAFGLTLNQLLSVGMFVVGLYLLMRKTTDKSVMV